MLKVGDIVFVVPIGPNNTRHMKGSILDNIKEETIEKVGNKYFYLKGWVREKFSIETMQDVSNYCEDWKVYTDKQQILDEVEYGELYSCIKSKFARWGKNDIFTLDQLRRINVIIKESDE